MSLSSDQASEKSRIKKTPDKTTPQPTKTPNKTPTPQPTKTPDKKPTPQPTKNTSDKTSARPKDTKKNDVTQPLERFFSQYSKFQYQPTRSPVIEFNRLRKEYGWERDLENARQAFKLAMEKGREHTKKNSVNKPLNIFFSRFSEFKYQSASSPMGEFIRLCKEYGWEKKFEDARRKFNLAMKKEFDALYGSDEEDINNWYKLCHVLRIDPAPNTLKECRKVSAQLLRPFISRSTESSSLLGCP